MNNVSNLAAQDNCLGKNSSLCGKIAVLFNAYLSIYWYLTQ